MGDFLISKVDRNIFGIYSQVQITQTPIVEKSDQENKIEDLIGRGASHINHRIEIEYFRYSTKCTIWIPVKM